MRLVTAIIQPHALERVADTLRGAGVHGITITEVVGSGRQGGHTEIYRGAAYRIDTIPKIKVEVVTTDAEEEAVIQTIVGAARSGEIGDGKVWSTQVGTVVRVRTGETGDEAI